MTLRPLAFHASFQFATFQLGLFLLGLFLLASSGMAGAQAIDCTSTALNNSAQAVCASTTLRSLAASMDQRYAHVAENPGVEQSQLEWIGARDRCNGNTACLTVIYRERNAYLAALPVAADSTAAAASSSVPLEPLFLRHAPAQLLISTSTQQPAAIDGPSAGDGRLDPAASPAPLDEHMTHSNPLWLLSGVLFAAIFLWQVLTNVCGKCPNCHHWFARVEIDQRNLVDDPSEFVTRRRRSLRQRALTSHPIMPAIATESIRARVTTVRHYNQCRMCLHEWETTSQETI